MALSKNIALVMITMCVKCHEARLDTFEYMAKVKFVFFLFFKKLVNIQRSRSQVKRFGTNGNALTQGIHM